LIWRKCWRDVRTCLRFLRTVGPLRLNNACCGRYLYAYTVLLWHKWRSLPKGLGEEGERLCERDGNLVSLLSGDAQGSTESSWVWDGMDASASSSGSSPEMEMGRVERAVDALAAGVWENEEELEWKGWESLESKISEVENWCERESGRSRISIANII